MKDEKELLTEFVRAVEKARSAKVDVTVAEAAVHKSDPPATYPRKVGDPMPKCPKCGSRGETVRTVIVPDAVRAAINERLEAQYEKFPDARMDNQRLFAELLEFCDDHGYIPVFSLQKREESP